MSLGAKTGMQTSWENWELRARHASIAATLWVKYIFVGYSRYYTAWSLFFFQRKLHSNFQIFLNDLLEHNLDLVLFFNTLFFFSLILFPFYMSWFFHSDLVPNFQFFAEHHWQAGNS